MSGLSKVIVLDPDVRASRQVQLGFQREGVPTWAAPIPVDAGKLQLLPDDGDASLVVVGGTGDRGIDLIRRARGLLEAAHMETPIVFSGRGVTREAAEAAGADEVILQPVHLRDVVTIGRLLRGAPANHRGHLIGSLAETTGVFTLVRALSALGRSATLTLIRGLRRGEVRFFFGEVTSAQVGLIHGQAALHQLLLWTDARFDYHHEDIVRRHQIPLAHDELFADAERFLATVRDESGPLSPSMVLEQDIARIHSLGKQIPTEVHGVLRMFDGHRVLADVLEDSPYRVFETLRVTQRALDVGLLRQASAPRPKATWRAVLAIEEWLVGGASAPPEEAKSAADNTGPHVKQRKKKKREATQPLKVQPYPNKPDIDWGALVPRVLGAEVGPLSGVVPAAHTSGEIVLPTRDEPREKLEALMDTGKRERIFPRDIGLEPSIVWDENAEIERVAAEAKAKAEAEDAARRESESKAALEAGASRDSADELARRLGKDTQRVPRVDADGVDLGAKAAEDKARVEGEAKSREADAEAKARAEADDKARIEAEAKARAEAEAKARAEAEAKARAEADDKARAEADDKARAEADDKARAEAEARTEAEAKAREQASVEAKALVEAEAEARVKAEAQARAEAEAKAAADDEARRAREAAELAEAKARAETETRAREEADAKAAAAVEAKFRTEAADRERAEAARLAAEQARAEAEANAKAEAEAKAREEAAAADAKVRAEAERKARIAAEAKAAADRAEAELRAQHARSRAESRSNTGKHDKRARAAKREAKRRDALEAKAIADARADAERRALADAAAEEISDTERTLPRERVDVSMTASDLVKALVADDRGGPGAPDAAPVSAPLAIETSGAVVDENAATSVSLRDRLTVTTTEQTARLVATPVATVTEALPERPSILRSPPVVVETPAAHDISDGVVRSKHDEPVSGPLPPVISKPQPSAVPDDRPEDRTGEITTPMAREQVDAPAEPSIIIPPGDGGIIPPGDGGVVPPGDDGVTADSVLVNDLAAAHSAVSAIATAQAAAPHSANAATPSKEHAVVAVRDDAQAAFSEIEEDFFRAGSDKSTVVPRVDSESFDDLDEGYQPVGFWDRLLGRNKQKPKKR